MMKIFKYLMFGLAGFVLTSNVATAQDITAVDFKGDVIGKVIPDGTAINFNNEIIGQLTADGFLISGKGNIIGGVVPQGFAVSNDHKYLGKVSSDGRVRLPSGKVAGKVLPSGLVVDELYNVVGAVLSTGIVYNDLGNAVGRLAGNGAYVNFEGQNLGFVSPSGYAYKQTDAGYVLDGKLLSSKMVVSLSGEFIGSVAPGGQVVNFDGAVIGKLHANGYVYDNLNKIIGRTVKSAYAFDDKGSYLGFVSYNGEVMDKGKVVAKLRADNRIADLNGKVIGYVVDMNAVALSANGKYLGYLAPNGEVLKGPEVVGNLGVHGLVFGANGDVLGQIAEHGPIFDHLGNIRAEAMPNGYAVSTEGSVLGFMKGSSAFDNAGFMLGKVMSPALVMNSKQDILGMTGIDSDFVLGSQKFKVSPLGFVWTADNVLAGNVASMDPIYAENGTLLGFVDVNGVVDAKGFENLSLKNNGAVIDEKNDIQGRQIKASWAVPEDKNSKLRLSNTNVLYDASGKEKAKILPEYEIVGVGADVLMPVIGYAGLASETVLGVRGDLIGYVDETGSVLSAGKEVGKIVSDGIALSNKNIYLGQISPFKPVVNDNCDVLGVVSPRGEVRSGRDNAIGKVLLSGEVISEVGQSVGHLALNGPVYGFDGSMIGVANEKGQVADDAGQVLGCLDADGRLYEDGTIFKGHVFDNAMVMDFENNIIGRVNFKNQFINNDGEVAGYLSPDGTVVNEKNKNLGLIFKYKVAFDRDNNFIGYVTPDGKVLNDKNEIFGLVTNDGLIVSKSKAVGYALYDLYVYDENGHAIGYLTKNGTVMSFSGQNLGKADRGFLVSKEGRLIARGKRDYFVRDKQNAVIGEILLSNKVMAHDGKLIATVSNNGDVRDESGKMLGSAKPLQFYVIKEGQAPAWARQPQGGIQVEPVKVPDQGDDTPLNSYDQKVIGVVLSPDGNYLGKLLESRDVISDAGEIIGHEENGVVSDKNGQIIGVVEENQESKPADDKSKTSGLSNNMFLPPDAYSTSEQPTNLGPGGGHGPGERYDPMRSYILSQAQNARVGDVRVGKLTSNVKKSSFDGYQDNWDNASYSLSSWRVDMSEMILADKPIPAVLARTIMDGSAGSGVPITAIVERNVYAEDGRVIVIPAGSRVMGESSGMSGGGNSGGAVRVNITWTRLIKPDGSAFEFAEALTGDAQGRAGALGYLDEQLLKRYTLPLATDLMTNALAYAIPGGKTTTSSEGSSTQDSRAAAAEQIRQSFLNDMNQIFQDILQRKTDIEAVTYVPAGTRLIIYPKVDLWLRTRAREDSEDYAKNIMKKPEVLIDDTDPMGSIHGKGTPQGASGTSSEPSASSKVVYSGENTGVQPTPLIDDGALNRKREQQRRQQMGMIPPPPSTTTTSGGSSNNQSSSEAALF